MKEYKTLQDMLKHLFASRNVANIEILSSKDRDAFLLGGLGSNSERAKVTFDDSSEVLDLFIKFCRKNSPADQYNQLLKTFDKEILFYEKLWPKMMAVLPPESRQEFEKFMPIFFGAGKVGEDLCMVMEDFVKRGFEVVAPEKFFTLQQLEISLDFLARLHSLTYVMRKKGDQSIWNEYQDLLRDEISLEVNEPMIKPFFSDPGEKYLDYMIHILAEKDKNNPILADLRVPPDVTKEVLSQLRDNCKNLLAAIWQNRQSTSTKEPTLCHGDYHMWNVAFQEESMKVFDFQVIHYGSFANDIHHLLSQTCTPKFREEHLSHLLNLFLERFNQTCSQFGLEPMTKDFLLEEYQARSPVGFLFGMNFLLTRFISDKEAFEAAKAVKDPEHLVKLLNKCHKNIWSTFGILFEFVREHALLGTPEKLRLASRDSPSMPK